MQHHDGVKVSEGLTETKKVKKGMIPTTKDTKCQSLLPTMFDRMRVLVQAPTTPVDQRPAFGFNSPPDGSFSLPFSFSPKEPPMRLRLRGKSHPHPPLSDGSVDPTQTALDGGSDARHADQPAADPVPVPDTRSTTFNWEKYIVPGWTKPTMRPTLQSSSRVPVPDQQTEITSFFSAASTSSSGPAPTPMDQGDQGPVQGGDVVQTPVPKDSVMESETEMQMERSSVRSVTPYSIPAAQPSPRTPEETPPPTPVDQLDGELPATQLYAAFPGYGPRPLLPRIPESFAEAEVADAAEVEMKDDENSVAGHFGCSDPDSTPRQPKQPRLTYDDSISSPPPLSPLPSPLVSTSAPCHIVTCDGTVLHETEDKKEIVTIMTSEETTQIRSISSTSGTATETQIGSKIPKIDKADGSSGSSGTSGSISEQVGSNEESMRVSTAAVSDAAAEDPCQAGSPDATGSLSRALIGPLVSPFGVLPPPRVVRSIEDAFDWPNHFIERMREAGQKTNWT